MKVLLWIGNAPNQKALANKIHEVIPLCGIITESRTHKRKITLKRVVEKVIDMTLFRSMSNSWRGLQDYYQQLYPEYPDTERLDVENINSDPAYEFTKKLNPDLILVSGTRLVKSKMLSVNPGVGILNLHTGLSPYIKGGPNCTNWCIATKQYHLIGNTIMWIDAGIDSGNILTTGFTPVNGSETLLELHKKVMDHAHALYLKAVVYLNNGGYNSIAQADIAEGKTYYTREWTLKAKFNLLRNFKQLKSSLQSEELDNARKNIRVIEI